MFFKKKKTRDAWAKLLGWPSWVSVGDGMVLWNSGEEGETRDLCASIVMHHNGIKASVSLCYLDDRVQIASFTLLPNGDTECYLIGEPDAGADEVAASILRHTQALGEPSMIDCLPNLPSIPSFLATRYLAEMLA